MDGRTDGRKDGSVTLGRFSLIPGLYHLTG